MSAPSVGVVVTACGDSAGLRRCLQQIAAEAAALRAETTLVVNTREQALTTDVRSELARLVDRLVFEATPGKSRALNRAIRGSDKSVLAFTDDDAQPDDGWLHAITAPLMTAAAASGPGGVGGRVLPEYGESSPPGWYRKLVGGADMHFLGPVHDLGTSARPYDGAKRWEAPVGANCAFLRSLLEEGYRVDLGPNRETGLRGSEDLEIGLRLMRRGHELLYVPSAIVRHPVTRSRMTLAYARGGFFAQGVEEVRVKQALGGPLPLPHRVRRRLRKTWLPILGNLFHRPQRSLEATMERARLRGILSELSKP